MVTDFQRELKGLRERIFINLTALVQREHAGSRTFSQATCGTMERWMPADPEMQREKRIAADEQFCKD